MNETNHCLTSFSTKTEYDEKMDFGYDSVIIDGLNNISEEKIKSWKEKGYAVQLCFSLSWGGYSDYLNGKWDDVNHWKEVQTDKKGNDILHGPNVPYFVPTMNFVRYLCDKIKPLIDAGLSAVQIQEPDFWFHGGFSIAFKREWEIVYKTPWESPLSSPDAAYRASKLKRFLFARAIFFLSSELKDYARNRHLKNFKIYIKTRGLLYNAISGIISPLFDREPSLIDGYYANISPKTISASKSDFFLSSYAEFNILKGIVRFSDQEIHYAINPNGDKALLSWEEYKRSYEQILTAAALNPEVNNYQVLSKPRDIFFRESKKIPDELLSEMLICANALTALREEKIRWKKSDNNSAAIFLSETMMFHGATDEKNFGRDSDVLTSLFGLFKPLCETGIDVDFLLLEKVCSTYKILNDYNVAILSYDFMKAPSPDFHYALQAWVKSGGVLIFIGDGKNRYNTAQEWWRTENRPYETPEDHLFEVLGIAGKIKKMRKKNTGLSLHQKNFSDSIFEIGKGIAAVIPENPISIFNEPAYRDFYLKLLLTAAEKQGIPFQCKGFYELCRGPYKIIATADRSVYKKSGLFISLFDQELEVRDEIRLQGGECGIFYDLDAKKDDDIGIIAIGAKVEDLKISSNGISFTAQLPKGLSSLCRLFVPYSCDVTINGVPTEFQRDKISKKTIIFPIEGNSDVLKIKATREKR